MLVYIIAVICVLLVVALVLAVVLMPEPFGLGVYNQVKFKTLQSPQSPADFTITKDAMGYTFTATHKQGAWSPRVDLLSNVKSGLTTFSGEYRTGGGAFRRVIIKRTASGMYQITFEDASGPLPNLSNWTNRLFYTAM